MNNSPSIGRNELAIVRREVSKFLGIRRVHAFRPGATKHLVSAKTDDLISVGHEGLFHALQTFDPDRGASWSTWATTCIRQAIWRTKPGVEDAMGGGHALVDIEKPFGDDDHGDDDWTLDETLTEDNRAVFWSEETLERRRKAAGKKDHDEQRFPVSVWRFLRMRMPVRREFSILLMRQLSYSRSEIGKRFNITAERVRQIEEEALLTAARVIQSDPAAAGLKARRHLQDQIEDGKSALNARPTNMSGVWRRQDDQRFAEEWEAKAFFGDDQWRHCLPDDLALYDANSIAMLSSKELSVTADRRAVAKDDMTTALIALAECFKVTPQAQPKASAA